MKRMNEKKKYIYIYLPWSFVASFIIFRILKFKLGSPENQPPEISEIPNLKTHHFQVPAVKLWGAVGGGIILKNFHLEKTRILTIIFFQWVKTNWPRSTILNMTLRDQNAGVFHLLFLVMLIFPLENIQQNMQVYEYGAKPESLWNMERWEGSYHHITMVDDQRLRSV